MNELEAVWSQMLAKAAEAARASGSGDLVDYLTLKASNDLLRTAASIWLFEGFIELAADAGLNNPYLSIEREDPHNFAYRGGNMVGSQLIVRQGVRCLTVEAGWTRTPSDGFMRGGALAAARVRHRGIPKANMDLILVPGAGAPSWKVVNGESTVKDFGEPDIRTHFTLFLS